MTTIIRALRRRTRDRGDGGFTLTELLISMGLFAALLAIIAAATTSMFQSLWKQTGQTDNLDSSRKVIARLDKQVRYANAITTPGTGTDGNYYVEWRSGNTGQQQTCYQWRLVIATKLFQYRTWQPPLFGSGSVTATGWVTQTNGISKSGATPVFSITPATSAVTASRELLTVTFVSTHGKPAKSTTSQVSLTAANATSASAPSSSLCNEVGRP